MTYRWTIELVNVQPCKINIFFFPSFARSQFRKTVDPYYVGRRYLKLRLHRNPLETTITLNSVFISDYSM